MEVHDKPVIVPYRQVDGYCYRLGDRQQCSQCAQGAMTRGLVSSRWVCFPVGHRSHIAFVLCHHVSRTFDLRFEAGGPRRNTVPFLGLAFQRPLG